MAQPPKNLWSVRLYGISIFNNKQINLINLVMVRIFRIFSIRVITLFLGGGAIRNSFHLLYSGNVKLT